MAIALSTGALGLLERDDVLGELLEAYEAAAVGRGRLVLVAVPEPRRRVLRHEPADAPFQQGLAALRALCPLD